MKHLGISGGGTKIGGLFSAAEVVLREKHYTPGIISGISAGALLTAPLAMGKFDQVRELVLDYSMNDFFSQRPVTTSGNLSMHALRNFFCGKPFLGRQDNLPKTIAKVVSADDFEQYKTSDAPVCVVGTVDFISGGRKYFNLKELTYNEYLLAVNASASIPIFTNAVMLRGYYLFDGGVRDHIATAWMLQHFPEISETVSIYSRPKDYKVLPSEFSDKNLIKILERYTEIVSTEVSKNDEWMEDMICRERNIRQTKIFLPRMMDSVYDVKREHLRQIYDAGRQAALDAWEA